MLILNFNELRTANQIEFDAYVDKSNILNISEKKFDNSEKITFRFFELNEKISKLLKKESIKKEYYLGQHYYYYDYLSYKTFILRNLLSWWSFDIKLERDEFGSLTNDSYENVLKIHPSILEHFLYIYDKVNDFPNEDNQRIIDQCHNLFRKGSKGITDADESIDIYCSLIGFWEKLGLNYYDVQKLPEDLFNKLQLIMKKDNEIQIQELEKSSKRSSNSGGNIIENYNF